MSGQQILSCIVLSASELFGKNVLWFFFVPFVFFVDKV
jgi:hypothetical protein